MGPQLADYFFSWYLAVVVERAASTTTPAQAHGAPPDHPPSLRLLGSWLLQCLICSNRCTFCGLSNPLQQSQVAAAAVIAHVLACSHPYHLLPLSLQLGRLLLLEGDEVGVGLGVVGPARLRVKVLQHRM